MIIAVKPEHLREIFWAGSTLATFASRVSYERELIFAVQEILNDGKAWDAPDRFSEEQVKEIMKKK